MNFTQVLESVYHYTLLQSKNNKTKQPKPLKYYGTTQYYLRNI